MNIIQEVLNKEEEEEEKLIILIIQIYIIWPYNCYKY